MFGLFILFSVFLFSTMKYCYKNKNYKNYKKLNYKIENLSYQLNKLTFYDDNHKEIYEVELNEIIYNFYENKKFNMLEIINKYFETNYKNLNNYKFCIIDYELNNEEFKFLFYHSNQQAGDENYILFPFYTLDEINNYIFINKIIKIVISSKNEEEEYDKNFENFILKFLGPNYNFYNDLGYFIDIQDLIKIYYFKNCNYLGDETFIKLYKENEPMIILNDKFTNKYKINKFLEWQPKINIR